MSGGKETTVRTIKTTCILFPGICALLEALANDLRRRWRGGPRADQDLTPSTTTAFHIATLTSPTHFSSCTGGITRYPC